MSENSDIDTGQPIPELAEIGEDPATGFAHRLWNRINRRRLGGELTDFGWQGIASIIAEYLSMIVEFLGPHTSPPDQSDEIGE